MSLPDNIKEITLTKGQVALVDADDYDYLMQWKWQTKYYKHNDSYYASRTIRKCGKKTTIRMHRVIMNVQNPRILIDHQNRNGLHNYKSNLRIATHSQNMSNRRAKINGASQYLGVSLNKRQNRWIAIIKTSVKSKFLGYFINEIDAALAYDKAAKEIHGQFANLNFKTINN